MTQLIITLVIVIIAIASAVYLIIRSFLKKKKKSDICSGCSSDCGGCKFYKEIKNAREHNQKN